MSVHGVLLRGARSSLCGSQFLCFASRSAWPLPHHPHFGRIAAALLNLSQFQRYMPHLVAAAVAYFILCLTDFFILMYSIHLRVTPNSHLTSCCFLFPRLHSCWHNKPFWHTILRRQFKCRRTKVPQFEFFSYVLYTEEHVWHIFHGE